MRGADQHRGATRSNDTRSSTRSGTGRFRRGKKIGAGGFGSVYLCTSNESGNQYVLKEVSLRGMAPKEQEAAVREVQILRKLRHPNIISYKDSFKNADKLSIVMEYASGGDLYARIQKQRGRCFPESVVVNWLVQILLALKYLHDNKLLHRDLKPQNMFLTSSGVVKLGDFGVARILDGTLACAQTQIGTPFYLSPEICRNKPYDAKSDMWSLGCVLYEILTLRPPFMAKDMRGMVEAILNSTPKPVSSLYSQPLRDLVMIGLINRDPAKRFDVRQCLKERFVRQTAQQMLGNPTNDSTPSTASVMHAAPPEDPEPSPDPLVGVLEVLNREKQAREESAAAQAEEAEPLAPLRVPEPRRALMLAQQEQCVHQHESAPNRAAAQIQAMMRHSWRRKGRGGYRPPPVVESNEPEQYNMGRFAAAGRNMRGNSRSRYEGRPDAAANKIQRFMRDSLKLRAANRSNRLLQ